MTKADSPATEVLQQALINSFNQHALQLHGRRIWLACSGGRDSLSLALLCRQLFDEGRLSFLPQLLHVNHGMQTANAQWAQQVKDWASQHDMPCTLLTLERSRLIHISEQSARNARYTAMMSMMNDNDVLILGHHQDDQVETVLMRLFKGAGVNGLSGMQDWTTFAMRRYKVNPDNQQDNQQNNRQDNYNASQQNSNAVYCQPKAILNSQATDNNATANKSIALWRPWLRVSRATITDYAKHANLDYIDDPTNVVMTLANINNNANTNSSTNINTNISADEPTAQNLFDLESLPKEAVNTNDRAWLRSVLMPVIAQRYPQVNEAIARTSQIMQATSMLIDEQVQIDLATVSVHSASLQNVSAMHSVLDIAQLQMLLPARQAALIHTWLSPQPTELPPSKTMVDSVLRLSWRADNDHQTVLYYNSGAYQYEVRRYQHQLYRLRSDWQYWLSIVPSRQYININNSYRVQDIHQNIENTTNDDFYNNHYQNDGQLSLKPRHLPFLWQTSSIYPLIEILKMPGDKLAIAPDSRLYFEPLPRDLKVTLAGRVGRKSGKKLLQALNQPVFMRQSLVLCSLLQKIPYANGPKTQRDPLFIIAIDRVYWLQNPLSEVLNRLIDIKAQTMTTYIIYRTTSL